MPETLGPRYDHQKTEKKIYELWEKSGFFNPDSLTHADKKRPRLSASSPRKSSFCIIMPPPNANGHLHAGHALFVTLEDIMTRFKRMMGYKTLWVPGTDHAGFETQIVYDRELEKQGRSRFTMDRKELFREIMAFTLKNKKHMENELRSLGASCDWSREKFTLDPDVVEKVQKTFEKMYRDGLIYRGKRIINWCYKHQTSLSDAETEFKEQKDNFYYLQYGPFVIGTARPETKFGDKYVVMHPDDKRYKRYKEGQKIDLEWINGSVTATVIKDKVVDMKFGTGVMTITPWHDPIDFEIAERHGLEKEQIIGFDGKLLPIAGEFVGMKINEARPLIVKKLKSKGLLVKIDENYVHSVRVCYKCNNSIEPQIMDQWFVKMKPLAKLALDAVKKGKIKFIPERFKKIFNYWMEHTLDWNISRQIVWGIRIPAWLCLGVPEKVMGFAGDVVQQVFDKKTRTYRLRDHGLRIGDKVFFENSRTKEIFGHAIITEIKKTKVGDIDLKDSKHWRVYEKHEELIAAFKRHHPEMEVTDKTPAWIYTYKFTPDHQPKIDHEVKINPEIKACWFLVRHGETDWNKEWRVQGHSSVGLNQTGKAQAQQTAELLKNHQIDLILSSDLPRAKETAEIIGKALGVEVVFDKALRERNLGKAEGMLREEAHIAFGNINEYEAKRADNESYREMEERVWEAFKKHRANHQHKNIVIVTHAGTIRMLRKRLKNLSPSQAFTYKTVDNASILEIDVLDPCKMCGGDLYEQDPDVFDTWFSSGQWPLLALNYPESKDFKTFYPTDVMETGYDLVFRWVPRMVIFGLYLAKEVPFKTVYMHGLVNDAQGKKMSKSRGNIINPLDLTEKYGTDALRMGLIVGNTAGTDLALSEDKIRGYRNFATKIWNVSRFVLMHKPTDEHGLDPSASLRASADKRGKILRITTTDKKNLKELDKIKKVVTKHLEKFEFHLAAEKIYHYFWHTFADKIIEEAKPRLQSDDPASRLAAYSTLKTILVESLTMLHPFMPFLTEEIYQKFYPGELLMMRKW